MALSSARGKLIGVIGDEVQISEMHELIGTLFRTLVLGSFLGALGSLTKTGKATKHFKLKVGKKCLLASWFY